MYTEKEHKQLFKRFFGKDVELKLLPLTPKVSLYCMMKNEFYFSFRHSFNIVEIENCQNPYTKIMKILYGKDIVISEQGDRLKLKTTYIHVPSSFEEMTIICDLKCK